MVPNREQHQPLVSGMLAYESQDVHMDAGTAPGSLSVSTDAAQNKTFLRTSDADSEPKGSMHTRSKTSCQEVGLFLLFSTFLDFPPKTRARKTNTKYNTIAEK